MSQSAVGLSLPTISNDERQQDSVARQATGRHVTLVRPALVASRGTWTSPITPPMGLAYLAGVLVKAGSSVEIVDAIAERVEQFIEEGHYVYQGLTIEETVARIPAHTEWIGVSCMFSQDWPYVRRLIDAIRARLASATIIVGGEHTSAMPEYCLRDCRAIDFCVLGEGEETLIELVARTGDRPGLEKTTGVAFLRGDEYVQTPPRARIKKVEEIPYPAWDLFPMDVYLNTRNGHGVYRGKTMGILATRGCPYKCTFCSNPTMYGKAYVPRDPADVLDEIELYINKYGAENIDFYDLTMILKRDWILDFCRQIEERGLNFTWQLPTGTRSEVIDEEVSRALFRTGCRNITYAPESGDPETLDKIKKKVHLPVLLASIKGALKAGINIKCNIIIGFPSERRINVLRTIVFCWKMAIMGVHDVGIFLFSPYPGSQLFRELLEDGTVGPVNDAYFEDLINYMETTSTKAFCKNVSGRELAFWRLFGMMTFFGLSYLVRPWRFFKFIRNVLNYESSTVLEQRVGAIVDRFRSQKSREPQMAAASSK